MKEPRAAAPGPSQVADRTDARSRFVRAVYPPGGIFGPHRHVEYLLVVVIEGSLDLEFADHGRRLTAGQATLTRPGLTGTYRFSRERPTTHTACQLVPTLIPRAEREILDALSGVFPASAGVQALISLGLTVPAGDAFLHASAEHIGRACLLHFAADCRRDAAGSTRYHPAMVRALDLLRAEAPAIANAADLARRSGVSPSRLRQLFRASGHPNPAAALWRAKTTHALRLIQQTGLTLAEVAAQSGFADPFHLSRLVKQLTGSSPRQLRQFPHAAPGTKPARIR